MGPGAEGDMTRDAPYEPVWIAKRAQRGPRALGRDEHYELCNGFDCPCYQEGTETRATSHYTMLQWFAAVDPTLMVRALTEVGHIDPLTNLVAVPDG